MNHLVTDVARAVASERLRQADLTRDGRRLSRNTRSNHMRRITRSSGTVLLAAAVFLLTLSGTATAAKLITGKQVKNGSITSVDLRDRSLSGGDIRDASLAEAHLAGPVHGPQGPPGEEGPRGPVGPRGPQGVSGLSYVVQAQTVPKGSTSTWSAACAAGSKVIGGGLSSGSPTWIWLVASAPEITGDSWVVTAENHSSTAVTAYAWAVCAASS